jgi:hypothetical protein
MQQEEEAEKKFVPCLRNQNSTPPSATSSSATVTDTAIAITVHLHHGELTTHT